MKLSQKFRSRVITVGPEESLWEAATKMRQDDVGAVVVVSDRRVVGVLTDRDVALAAILDGATKDALVRDVMTKDVVTVSDNQETFRATEYFAGHRFRRLPIVDERNILVGILTTDDLLCSISRELANITRPMTPIE